MESKIKMNNTKQNHSRFGIVLSGALLAAAVFAVPGIFKGQQEAEVVENYYPAIPMQAAPSAPEVSSSTGSTTLYIQNKEAIAGSVYVTFYQDSGASIDLTSCLAGTAGVTNTIPASGNLMLNYATCGSLASGSRGSSVVSSDVDVAVVIDSSFTPNRVTGGTIGFSAGSNDITVPTLASNLANQSNATLYVQNTESTTRTATLEFFKEGVVGAIFSITTTLPPFSSKAFDLGSDPMFAIGAFSNYRGSAHIYGAGGVGLFAATVDLRNNTAGLGSTNVLSQQMYSYNSFNAGSLVYYLPILRRNVANYFSSIQIANFNASPATVNIEFIGGPASPGVNGIVTLTIPANNSVYYNQASTSAGLYTSPPQSMIGANWNGSGVLTSTLPIQVTVKDASPNGIGNRVTNATYKAFTTNDSSNEVFLPLLRNQNNTSLFGTNVRIQNLGITTATIRIDYTPTSGSPTISGAQLYDEVSIGPGKLGGFGQFAGYNISSTVTLPAGFIGSGYLRVVSGPGSTTIDPTGKIVVIVNDISRTTVTADASDQGSYEGIKR